MKTVLINNAKDALRLEGAWNNISSAEEDDVFLSFAWFKHNIENFPGINLMLLAIEDKGTIKAIAPFIKTKIFFRILFFKMPLQAVEFISNPFYTLCDFINTGENTKLLSLFINEIDKDRKWDIIALAWIPQSSHNFNAINEVLTKQKRRFIIRTTYRPCVKTTLNRDDYLITQPKRLRKTIRNIKNRLDRLGGIDIECYQNFNNINQLFDIFLDICKHNKRIKDPEYLSNSAEKQRLFLNLLKSANENGWLRVWVLKTKEKIIAAELDLFCGKISHAIFSVYDERYKEYSPGSFLNWHIIKQCIDNSWQYDLGPGGVDYKILWTKNIEKSFKFIVFNNKPALIFLYYFYLFKEAVKKKLTKEKLYF